MSDLTIEKVRQMLTEIPEEWWWDYGVSLRTAWGLKTRGKYVLRFAGPNDISLCPDPEGAMEFIEECPRVVRFLLTEFDRLAQQSTSADFWNRWVYPEGASAEQVQNELKDYHWLLESVAKVYEHITGGAVSKQNTLPEVVIGLADDCVTSLIGEETKELQAEVDRLQARVEELEKSLKSSPECWHFNNERREEFMERYWAWRSAALEGRK